MKNLQIIVEGSSEETFVNDVLRWIESDRGRVNTFYTSFNDWITKLENI